MPKDLAGAESQKSRRRQHEDKNNPTVSSSRRKLSTDDVPDTLRVIEGRPMNDLPAWLNTNIISAIQQLEEASRGTSRGVDNVQILLNAIAECKLQLITVAHQGEENLQRCTVVNDRERGIKKRYDFCDQSCGGGGGGGGFTTKLLSKYKVYGHMFARMLRLNWIVVAKFPAKS